MYPYHNIAKKRIREGKLVGYKIVPNYQRQGERMLLLFNSLPDIVPIKPDRYDEYKPLLKQWERGEFNHGAKI